MPTPLFSVLMPVHNCGAYLRAAVASIVRQSCSSWELIIVDDGSTDGAVEALEPHPQIRIVANHGKGIVDALNTAAFHARGELLARMDGDDIAALDRLQVQTEFLAANPEVGIVGGQVEVFRDGTAVDGGYRHYAEWINGLTDWRDIQRQIFIESPIPHPTAVIRRGVFARLGGYRDAPWAEDYDLWLRAYSAGVVMAKPRGVVLHWRDRPQRASRVDCRYSPENFVRAKAHYLARTLLSQRPACIWGAGPTGARLADALLGEGVVVEGFIDVDPRKIGGRKRGLPVWDVSRLAARSDALILGAVGSRGARQLMRDALWRCQYREGTDFVFTA